MIFSARIARMAHTEIKGPLVAIGPRSLFPKFDSWWPAVTWGAAAPRKGDNFYGVASSAPQDPLPSLSKVPPSLKRGAFRLSRFPEGRTPSPGPVMRPPYMRP